MSSEGLVTIDNDYGEIVSSAGGKDITGDGFPDTVLLINVDNTWLDLVIHSWRSGHRWEYQSNSLLGYMLELYIWIYSN